MPLYDFKCTSCNEIEERLFKTSINLNEEFQCRCGGFQEMIFPLPNMQPDNMWHFGNTGLGNFSSKKEYNTYIKNNNLERATRENYESAQKKQANRFETVAKKNKENLTKFIEKELAGVEVSPDGNTVKEKNKYNKVRD